MLKVINTERFSDSLRRRSVKLLEGQVLLTDFRGTDQERDLSEPPNCDGIGRIRHFRRGTSAGWPSNPLPIDPASRALGIAREQVMRAQAFQLAACNWRCWYCYVPFPSLSADQRHARWVSADEAIDRYLAEPDPPLVIDLTGGQPDLVPEWIVWTMDALRSRGLADRVYLWSDDNLSNDYLWRFLEAPQLEQLASFRNYGRVGCFKGYDSSSFAFNTGAAPELFDQQFELMRRLMALGLDLYAYATFTSPDGADVAEEMPRFVDRLQAVHVNLPLRTTPLEIQSFTPVVPRVTAEHATALGNQQRAIEAWNREIEARFPPAARAMDVSAVTMRNVS